MAPKTYGPLDRRAELVRRGLRFTEIARRTRTNKALVHAVLNGKQLRGEMGTRVTAYIAGVLGERLEVVFPELARPDGRLAKWSRAS